MTAPKRYCIHWNRTIERGDVSDLVEIESNGHCWTIFQSDDSPSEMRSRFKGHLVAVVNTVEVTERKYERLGLFPVARMTAAEIRQRGGVNS